MRGWFLNVVLLVVLALLAVFVVGLWRDYQDGRQQGHDDSCLIAARNGVHLAGCP